MTKLGFGELELSILNTIRRLDRATVRDVHAALRNPGSYTTTMTVMSRLAEKGELARERVGKQYVYWINNQSSSKIVLKRIQDKIFGGDSVALVSYLLQDDQAITDAELQAIENLIKQKRKERGYT